MKILLLILLLSVLAMVPLRSEPVKAKKPFVLYAQLLQDTQVELSDGATWVMDKGDCFPIYMFKDTQTNVVLQLASANFMTEAWRVRVMKDAETPTALASYRKNVTSYLRAQSDKWKDSAKSKPK